MTVDDSDAVFHWFSDENVSRYMVYNTYKSIHEVLESLTVIKELDSEYHFGFVRKEDNLLVGSEIIGPDENRDGFWAFGYNLRKDCWGNGYATEAAKAMLQFAYKQFGITKFSSSYVEENKASGRVIEKCGLHFVKYGQVQKSDGGYTMRTMEYEGELIIKNSYNYML